MSERLRELIDRMVEPGPKCSHLSSSEIHEVYEEVTELLERDMPEVTEQKAVWIAWTNTDCTEGRGQQVPLAVCEAESTARRMGRRGSVQGSDCEVTEGIAVMVEGRAQWLAPCRIHSPTREDEKDEKRLEAERQAAQRKREALERAKVAGLSEEDIKALGGGS